MEGHYLVEKIIQSIFSIKNIGNHKVLTILGIKIKFKKTNERKKDDDVLNYLEVDIVDHCNLNCSGCTHFCPLVGENYMDVEQFKKDLLQLKTFFSEIKQFRILGGEPLLHKDIAKFIQYSREILPNSDIRIVTNGLLLSKMPDEFFDALKKCNVIVDLSKYPVAGEKFSDALDKIGEKECQLGFIHLCKKFWLALVSDGSQDKEESFKRCTHKNCKSLKNGKLYICPPAAFMPRYNKYFNKNIPWDKGIDIYNADKKQIKEYFETPLETCRYCLSKKDFKFISWKVSKRDENEWFADKN